MKNTGLIPVVDALNKNGFVALNFSSREDFYDKFLDDIQDAKIIGVGGSVTVRELDLIEKLKKMGKEVIHHWQPGLTEEADEPIRKKAITGDLFLTSTNALTETGYLINIDGIGNRVAAMSFGPKRVFVVAGVNKIVKDAAAGIRRVKNVAAPLNARRIRAHVPCAVSGQCEECDSPHRICRVILIHERAPLRTEMRVYLLNENLGF